MPFNRKLSAQSQIPQFFSKLRFRLRKNAEFVMIKLMSRGVISGAVCFVIGFAFALGVSLFPPIGGGRFDPAKTGDVVELRRLVYSLSPVVSALQREQSLGQVLPEKLDDLSGLPLHFVESFPALSYNKDGDSYRLYYKLGWDPSLEYDSRPGVWSYDSGDGTSPTAIAQ